ncbi:PREDICTED: protein IQ-DOMAIN 1-like [Camelina sativa]|uniref:Protein IQ-DOMAIN 1-like n=1 Tax=Camelina sativa TaxID=90675 RepID=A0ABM1RQN6_CAMSA|nr:PREDICTED: protein IQ-DOMAIN 1-like [Camelina sativa]XP_019101324.1 PREDICTED: protein IQ-DOMAIN 1-like [Camelina sativa]
MGSGNLIKAIIRLKRGKQRSIKNEKGFVKPKASKKKGTLSSALVTRTEDWAATRIQTAFKAYKARKSLRRLKGIARAKLSTEKHSVKNQAVVTLRYLHSWSKIQSEIKARRVCMVTEWRLKNKRLEHQQKLEAKLHDVEVEWNGGSETKDEILERILQREEATIKRERALAYAFSHQWKADGKTQWLGSYELGNTNWGWSWKERWISARPWEVRYTVTPKKPKSSKTTFCKSETNSNSPAKRVMSLSSVPAKASSLGAKNTVKPRRLSFPGA